MSGICATGLKKCRPTSRSGRASFAASGSSVMLEVFVARRAVGFMRGSRRAYSSRFASRFSKMASTTTSASGTPCAFDIRAQALACIRPLARVSRMRFSNSSCARLMRRLDEFGAAILQRDGEAAQRAPRSDVAAHDACADDMHVTRPAGAPLPPMAFSRSCSRNTRIEIARGLGGEEMRDRARFGFVSLLAARAVLRPQIDDRVRRRVVLALRLAGDLRDQRRLHERAHDRPAQHLLPRMAGGDAAASSSMMSRAAGFEVRRRDESIDEAEPQRLVRAHGPAGEHHLHGGLHADEPHACAPCRRSRDGCRAALPASPSDRRSSPDGDAIAAGQRQLEAAAQRETVNGRHRGAGECLELVEHQLAGANERVRIRGALEAVNSLMSAPATKPLVLAERTTTPLRRLAAKRRRAARRAPRARRGRARSWTCRACPG